jgi:hypothetical protein
VIEIERINDQLYGKTAGQPTLELTPQSENIFLLNDIGAQMKFNVDKSGTVISLTFSQGDQGMEGKKMK